MKGFERKNQLFSLCGLNCGLCPMRLGNYCGGCGNGNQSCGIAHYLHVFSNLDNMFIWVIKADLQNVVLNMERLNIAMSANNIRVKNINTLMIMILSSRINGEKQI
mgnify:CR=1 FL=1